MRRQDVERSAAGMESGHAKVGHLRNMGWFQYIYIYIMCIYKYKYTSSSYLHVTHTHTHIYIYIYVCTFRERERSKYLLGQYLGSDLGGYFSWSVWIYIVVYIHNTYTDHNMKTHICSSLVLQQGMGNSLENLFANPAAVAESRYFSSKMPLRELVRRRFWTQMSKQQAELHPESLDVLFCSWN